jgi:hypothetical protein
VVVNTECDSSYDLSKISSKTPERCVWIKF